MIAIILAVLGVPIWLLLGAIGGALWSRRRYRAQPGVIRLKERDEDDWPRRDGFGQLVHDVLVVSQGLALVRTTVRGVTSAVEVSLLEPPPDGFESVFRLEFDDGASAIVAVDEFAVQRFHELAHRRPVHDADSESS